MTVIVIIIFAGSVLVGAALVLNQVSSWFYGRVQHYCPLGDAASSNLILHRANDCSILLSC